MGILFPFLFLLFLFVDGKVESASAHQTEYYAVHFCADAAVCAFGITFIPSGKRKVASEIYLGMKRQKKRLRENIPEGVLCMKVL